MKKQQTIKCFVLAGVLSVIALSSGCLLDSEGTGVLIEEGGLMGDYLLDEDITTTDAITILYHHEDFYSGIGYGLGVSEHPWGFTLTIFPRGECDMKIGLDFRHVGSDGSDLGGGTESGVILYTPPSVEGGEIEAITFRLNDSDATVYTLNRITETR